MGNEFKSISSQDGSCSVDVGEYAGEYKVRFKVGDIERGTINDAGLFEIDNIKCSGSIQTISYQVNTVSVMGGSLVVTRGDALAEDMTALDSATLKITGNETFAVNDRLQINNGVASEFFIVTNAASAPTYTVTRDAAGVYGPDANPAWVKGTAVVNYGAPGEGVIWLTASDNNAPFISIFTHAGSPWADAVERCRFGNLNGYLGYSSDTYGVGIGSISAGEANLTFDPTNGIRLRQGPTNIMTIDMSGGAQISGFTISASDGFYAGSGATRVQMRPGDGFWCGATAQADAPFKVTAAGILTASDVVITGALTTDPGSSVDGQYIENATITGDSIANATITGDNITNGTITSTDIANATITGGNIASGTITSGNITNGTITGTDIANATITGGKIANATITGGNIASATVAGSNIVNGTITATDIANATITGGKIASATITSGNIANSTITGGNIASGTITGGNIGNLEITAGLIDNLTITASQIANLTITGGDSGKIATSTITETNIVANTITASSIAANAITTSELAANSVTSSHIVAGTIVASDIATSTITASELKGTAFGTLTITSGKIAINTTDALEIQANGNMKLLAGSDIDVYSTSTNFSWINFYGYTSVLQGRIGATSTLWVEFQPGTVNHGLKLGSTSYVWNHLEAVGRTATIKAHYASTDEAYFYAYGGSNSYVSLKVKNGSTTAYYLKYDGWLLNPSVHKGCDLGSASYAFDDIYIDDTYNVADFYNFDIHDDLAAINGIKGSGVYDDVTGNELIDDNTLPRWLLGKYKKDSDNNKKGNIMYDPDGKPYLSLKTCISLAWGAIRQLDKKIEKLNGGVK